MGQALDLGEDGIPAMIALSTSLLRQGKREEALDLQKQIAELRAEWSQTQSADQFQTEYARDFRHRVVQVFVTDVRDGRPSSSALRLRASTSEARSCSRNAAAMRESSPLISLVAGSPRSLPAAVMAR